MSVFDAIDKILNEMEIAMFYPPRGRVFIMPMTVMVKEKSEDDLKRTVRKEQEECSHYPAEDTQSWHKDPVYGVFHSADYVGSVKLDINGHSVFADIDDVKKLYAQLGPVLKKYKKEHMNDE